jgi:hypothetical protein
MSKKFTYKGYEFWITIDRCVLITSGLVGYIAYFNYENPALILGESIKDSEGRSILFNSFEDALNTAKEFQKTKIDNIKKGIKMK